MLTEKLIINMVNTVQTGVVLLNSEFSIIYSNKYFQDKSGYSHQELKGMGFFTKLIQEAEMRKILLNKAQSCANKPFNNLEINMVKKTGVSLMTKINGTSFMEEEQSFTCFIITDITSEKAYERVIQAGYDNLQQTTIDLDSALTKIKEQQALLTEYKRKMTRELAIATNVQNAIIPAKFISNEKLNIWAVSRPSEELGGDYFDFFQLDTNIIGILIADVVGHGVPAALIAAMLKAYFEYYTKHFRKPEEVFSHVNKAMSEMLEDTGLYLTAFYSVIDLSRMEINSASAGHDSSLCFYPDETKPLELTNTPNGPILGAFSEAEYESTPFKLKPGSRLLFFTDGITEAKNSKNEFFGIEKLIAFINQHMGNSPKETIEGILEATNQFCGDKKPADDRTVMIIDVLPEWQSLKMEKLQLDKAKELINKKENEAALQILIEIITGNRKCTEAYLLAGQAFIVSGKYLEAEKYLGYALEMDKNNYKGYYYLGINYYQQKQYEEAKDCWQKVRELFGNYKNTERFLEKVEKR